MNLELKIDKRLVWLDAIKGYMMIFVILHHMPGLFKPYEILFRPIGMVAFFFVSGFLLNENKAPKDFIIGKIRGIIIPFIIFGILNSVLYSNSFLHIYDASFKENFINIFIQISGKNDDLWFLPCLFLCFIFTYYNKRILNKYSFAFSFVIFCMSIVTLKFNPVYLPWHLEVVLVMQFFMMLGNLFNRFNIHLYFSKYKLYCIFPLLYLLYIYIDCKYIHSSYDPHMSEYGIVYIYPLLSVLGMLSLIIVISKIPFVRFMDFIGRNTLLFYALQIDFMMFYYAYISGKLVRHFNINTGIDNVCAFMFILLGCSCASIFINRFVPEIVGKRRK